MLSTVASSSAWRDVVSVGFSSAATCAERPTDGALDVRDDRTDLLVCLVDPLANGRELGILPRKLARRRRHAVLEEVDASAQIVPVLVAQPGERLGDLRCVLVEPVAKRCELALSPREAGRGRRDGRGEGVDALGEPLDLASEAVEPVVARLGSLGRECRQRRTDLLELTGRGSAAELGSQRVELRSALVELPPQGGDVPVLPRERSGRDRDRGGKGGEAVREDVDTVRQAALELGVVLRRRLDRAAELLRGLLVAGEELGGADSNVDLVDPGRQRLDALLERAPDVLSSAVRRARHEPFLRRSSGRCAGASGPREGCALTGHAHN